jgi:hypothetical protein
MNDGTLPDDLHACHAMIKQLREKLAECQGKLAAHEENQRREWERLYGRGVTPQSTLNVGLPIEGKGGVVRSKDPNDPTCGELFAQRRAAEREQRKLQRQLRKQSRQG